MTARDTRHLWASLRLLVLDIETACADAESRHKAVSMAVVEVKGGKIKGITDFPRINPEVPILPFFSEKHGITDGDVAGKPTFGEIAGSLVPLFTPRPSERLVIVCHNINFDIPIVRHQMRDAGHRVPEVLLLDTMRPQLRSLAGVDPLDNSLAGLLIALGITNDAPHTASADARATALAVIALFERIADRHRLDARSLLEQASKHTSRTVRYAGPAFPELAEPVIPANHEAGHNIVLPARPITARLNSWTTGVIECAGLRCEGIKDRVAASHLTPHAILLPGLLDGVRLLLAERPVRTGAVATLLGAVLPLLPDLGGTTGRIVRRDTALALDAELGDGLDALKRCSGTDLCPACRRGRSCPLDVWRIPLATVVAGGLSGRNAPAGIFLTTGARAGAGLWRSLRPSQPAIADATLRITHRYLLAINQADSATALAQRSIEMGCRDPEIAESLAASLASSGRVADLTAAKAICDRITPFRNDSTDDAWTGLETRDAQIAGRLARLGPHAMRRHHPVNPRTRPPRFLRLVSA